MGKKGAKRKTRWRTLSIGTPPGEEDEDEGVRNNGFAKPEHSREAAHRNGYVNSNGPAPWLKSRHGSAGSSGSGNGNGSTTSGYASGGSRSRRDDSSESPTQQQKVAFNEDEYTRITTPRQDMLFKKGYLSQKKLWHASTASMSATPSTTESQSASHSTADGSEAAEDQQLLDSSATGEYAAAPVLEAAAPAQLSYGTYYDHTSGYYYEYPMMLVAPAMPEQMGPNILTAMPCAPVPLRPIEWVNPAFVPKLASQQYCYMDYQAAQGTDCAALVDAQGMPLAVTSEPVPATMNGLSNEASLTGSASASASVSASGSIADESLATSTAFLVDEQQEQQQVTDLEQQQPVELEQSMDQQPIELQEDDGLEYSEATPYVETLPAQPVHLAHMMPQPIGQPYLYPGQYMFGPPVVNVNGVTMQSGPMLRCSDMVASTAAAACAKRRRKKKKRKQKRPHALGNTEDDDGEDYSSEGENSLSFPPVSWSVTASPSLSSTRPLNPECQEFHLRSTVVEPIADLVVVPVDNMELPYFTETLETNGETTEDCEASMLKSYADNEPLRLTDGEPTEAPVHEETANSKNLDDDKTLSNGYMTNGSQEIDETNDVDLQNLVTRNSNGAPRRKYSGKSLKIVREPTPGPDLDDSGIITEDVAKMKNEERLVDEVTTMIASTTIVGATVPQKDGDLDICQTWVNESSITSESCCNETNETTTMTTTTASAALATKATNDEDSGFESQSKVVTSSARPITDAVTEWLKRANSPDLFITSSMTSDDEDEDDDEDDDASVCNEPSKNLQGNPMPALSVNGGADGREASHGKFANHGDRTYNRVCEDDENESKPLNGTSSNKNTKSRGAKRRAAKIRKRNAEAIASREDKRGNKQALAQGDTQTSVGTSKRALEKKIDAICEFTEKDSDAGMRVAENSRITMRTVEDVARLRKIREGSCKSIDDVKSVKTFEKGEIVVSMDGELLHVAPAVHEERVIELNSTAIERRNSSSTVEEEHEPSIGSIEEPDVLECWEAETVEPVITPKKVLKEELADDELLAGKDMEHVQRYYRLQASVTSVEDDSTSVALNEAIKGSVANTPMTESTCSEGEEIQIAVPEVLGKSCQHVDPRLPVDEAFEVYESCYTGKPAPLPFASIDPKLGKTTRLLGRDEEKPIPCRAVCCNIQ